MSSEKISVRHNAKKFRDQLNVLPEWAIEAADNFMGAVPIPENAIVSVYYPIGSEIDPSPIVEQLWQKNIQVCLPCIEAGERGLKFAPWTRQTKLDGGKFGTAEPSDKTTLCIPDIVIVPLLVFDQRGNRMGYGQGHYDETLRELRAKKDVLAVGLAYAEQAVLLALPTEPHDQRLDMVVTPQRVFDFRA
jgi:5-formyltetrahydrofolate cyclo-ligase